MQVKYHMNNKEVQSATRAVMPLHQQFALYKCIYAQQSYDPKVSSRQNGPSDVSHAGLSNSLAQTVKSIHSVDFALKTRVHGYGFLPFIVILSTHPKHDKTELLFDDGQTLPILGKTNFGFDYILVFSIYLNF